jgi:hypothetical protein
MSNSLLRVVEDPRGIDFRLGRNDHATMMQVLAAGAARIRGVVFAAHLESRQQEMRFEPSRRGAETVLAPLALELATAGDGTTKHMLRSAGVSDPALTRAMARGV